MRGRHLDLLISKCQLPTVNYYHKELHLGCCSSPISLSEYAIRTSLTCHSYVLMCHLHVIRWSLKCQSDITRDVICMLLVCE